MPDIVSLEVDDSTQHTHGHQQFEDENIILLIMDMLQHMQLLQDEEIMLYYEKCLLFDEDDIIE